MADERVPAQVQSTKQQQTQEKQLQSPDKLLLSFENPNYQLERQLKTMDQARIDDHLNSNIAPNMYEELCRELKIYTDLSSGSNFYTDIDDRSTIETISRGRIGK